jgi:pepF/M3 family oligoendopeptidase
MTVVFPGLESTEFAAEFDDLIGSIDSLAKLFDQREIAPRPDGAVDGGTVADFETVMQQYGDLVERLTTVIAYINAFVTTDSRDTVAQARMSELQVHLVRLSQLQTRFLAWIGSLDPDQLIERSGVAAEHEYMLRRAQVSAEHLMSPAEENLAAELSVSGSTAWAKLYTTLTSQLAVPIELDGERQELPISIVRNLALDPNRQTRRIAYDAELAAWERAAVPLAAALNSIKGETNTLDDRRGWETALDLALFNNGIDKQTLDAMLDSARASFPDFRRYLRAKARALGIDNLTWYDLFAPLGGEGRPWDFDSARAFLLDQFGTYSDRLRTFAERAFAQRWIDAEPRDGKRGGAFCMQLRPGESRVLTNFVPTYEGMSTLAHELGHAYHNYNLAHRSPFQRSNPMTLAETASIFCETIVQRAALESADSQERLSILESALQGATQVVVDITSRFLFEQAVFQRRRQRELSIEELNTLMLESQLETYGEGLDENVLHPYMWAVKGHYYSSDRPFYNFPYMFGLLFGLGLYAQYEQDPGAFRSGYDDLLSATTLADAATLASRFGIDIRSTCFWAGSLSVVRANIDAFEQLVAAESAGA